MAMESNPPGSGSLTSTQCTCSVYAFKPHLSNKSHWEPLKLSTACHQLSSPRETHPQEYWPPSICLTWPPALKPGSESLLWAVDETWHSVLVRHSPLPHHLHCHHTSSWLDEPGNHQRAAGGHPRALDLPEGNPQQQLSISLNQPWQRWLGKHHWDFQVSGNKGRVAQWKLTTAPSPTNAQLPMHGP